VRTRTAVRGSASFPRAKSNRPLPASERSAQRRLDNELLADVVELLDIVRQLAAHLARRRSWR
jgi:hypothetical protein